MCRNIKTLYNFKPPATEDEIRASALQFVRKLSGFTRPSSANQPAFDRAVDQVTEAAHELLASLVTTCSAPRSRCRGRQGASQRLVSARVKKPAFRQGAAFAVMAPNRRFALTTPTDTRLRAP